MNLDPRLLLFVSVDLIGSTRYKATCPIVGHVPEWLLTFRSFYSDFPALLAATCRKIGIPVPKLWKSLGDELLFYSPLKTFTDASDLVTAVRAVVRDYNNVLKAKNVPLGIKAAAWVAGFPVGHSEIEIADHSDPTPQKQIDFVGPLIDIGFRISKFANRRKFVVSVDLALLILCDGRADLHFYFDDPVVLKGVLADCPYPIIWIDMRGTSKEPEEELRGGPVSASALKEYCESFIKGSGGAIMRPFIDGDGKFNLRPDDWERRYQATRSLLLSEQIPADQKDPASKDGPKPLPESMRKLIEEVRSLLKP